MAAETDCHCHRHDHELGEAGDATTITKTWMRPGSFCKLGCKVAALRSLRPEQGRDRAARDASARSAQPPTAHSKNASMNGVGNVADAVSRTGGRCSRRAANGPAQVTRVAFDDERAEDLLLVVSDLLDSNACLGVP
jgi:hypothetical protein